MWLLNRAALTSHLWLLAHTTAYKVQRWTERMVVLGGLARQHLAPVFRR